MHHVFARQVPPLGVLDQVDFADQVGDRDVGRRQFFVIAAVAADPFDRAGVAFLRDEIARVFGERGQRIVVDFRAGDDRDGVVEQLDQHPQHAGLALAAQTQKQHVVPRQDGVHDLRNDRLVVAEDPWKQRFAFAELAEQVAAHLAFDAGDLISTGPQLAEVFRSVGHSWFVPSAVTRKSAVSKRSVHADSTSGEL